MADFAHGWRGPTDFCFRFTIHGKPAVLKNNRKLVTMGSRCPSCNRGRKLSSVPSDRARQWMVDAVEQLRAQWPYREPIPKNVDVHAVIVTYVDNKQARDLSNSYGCPEDVLEPDPDQYWVGILTNDSQIKSHDGSRIRFDKDGPRVEITLRPFLDK